MFENVQVMCVYITGHLNTVFHAEHRKEILRYLYYHQVQELEEGSSSLRSSINLYVCLCRVIYWLHLGMAISFAFKSFLAIDKIRCVEGNLGLMIAFDCRMKMVVGDCTLRDTVLCSVQLWATYACASLERDPMVVKTMHVPVHINGSSTMAVSPTFHHGARLGSQCVLSVLSHYLARFLFTNWNAYYWRMGWKWIFWKEPWLSVLFTNYNAYFEEWDGK